MNGYDLIKAFYDRVAELPDMQTRCKSHHLSLYTWLCELHNRTKREVMDLPREYTMTMCFIGSPSVFRNTVDDLESWGLIVIVQRGNNQWQTTKVSFACSFLNKQDTSNEQATSQADTQATSQPLNTTKRTKTTKEVKEVNKDYPPEFEVFWKTYAKPSASKKDAFAQWIKLKPDEQQAATTALSAYIDYQPESRFRKDPERYLKHQVWQNDFSQPDQPLNGHPTSGGKKEMVY